MIWRAVCSPVRTHSLRKWSRKSVTRQPKEALGSLILYCYALPVRRRENNVLDSKGSLPEIDFIPY